MRWLEYLLPLIFLTPLFATAVVVIGLRHLFQDKPGFSPSGHRLRQSGNRFRERLAEARVKLFLAGALGPVIAITPLIYGMGRMLFSSHQDWLEWSIYGLITTIAALIVGAFMMALSYRISNLRLRLAGAMNVAHDLQNLLRTQHQGLYIFHDVPADGFTIDHVVITEHGIFSLLVRTRQAGPEIAQNGAHTLRLEGERLHFPDREETRPVREAQRARRWLQERLSRDCKREVPVKAVLVLPGWRIERVRDNDDVQVLGDKELSDFMQHSERPALPQPLHDDVLRALVRLTDDQQTHHGLSPTPR
ncbi:nuclease-related domain-containing protein [Kushneria indalinina]|uniref:Nuclease-like protein n=1 Tax=Kushneria indalinina DSM 14324 TaxID=1122140 RepID=A0A3D9DWX6_9GAMM|nr:nuclease-related domain-containing protein [Kushneria indalinina]REC95277.1 nuclease-like protein [Kushneria indalinina DSM 14324]